MAKINQVYVSDRVRELTDQLMERLIEEGKEDLAGTDILEALLRDATRGKIKLNVNKVIPVGLALEKVTSKLEELAAEPFTRERLKIVTEHLARYADETESALKEGKEIEPSDVNKTRARKERKKAAEIETASPNESQVPLDVS